jgi:hypothetical protein
LGKDSRLSRRLLLTEGGSSAPTGGQNRFQRYAADAFDNKRSLNEEVGATKPLRVISRILGMLQRLADLTILVGEPTDREVNLR